jgi:hypothetical protein
MLSDAEKLAILNEVDEVLAPVMERKPVERYPDEFTADEYAAHKGISAGAARRRLKKAKTMGLVVMRKGAALQGGAQYYWKINKGRSK